MVRLRGCAPGQRAAAKRRVAPLRISLPPEILSPNPGYCRLDTCAKRRVAAPGAVSGLAAGIPGRRNGIREGVRGAGLALPYLG
jgi:hypothetical protein